jgi:unsaturated chondroitin disaccharide hydrolase
MKNAVLFSMIAIALLVSSCGKQTLLDPEQEKLITERYANLMTAAGDLTRFPRTTDTAGHLVTTDVYDWTSGFYASNLWYIYELTGDEKWKNEAIRWTEALDTIQYWSGNHDVGFMINCSYGNGLRLTGNEAYRQVIVNAAESLIKRFNPVTGCIKSWDYNKAWNDTTEWFYPVIIDNMMNLELLFEAGKFSGDEKFSKIAVTHANTTMKNHYRPDYSSYHVVNYDTLTGAILDRATCQGFADESAWSRGQSWGLYGFVLCYRYTRDPKYLDFAEHIALYLLKHPNMPEDKIPFWDYNAGDSAYKPGWKSHANAMTTIPRDASAAAIMASALLELSTFSTAYGQEFRNAADAIVQTLSSPGYTQAPLNPYFILNHSVGSIPHGVEIDVPLVYADYYYLEALLRQKKL